MNPLISGFRSGLRARSAAADALQGDRRASWLEKADNIKQAWAHYEAGQTELTSYPFVATIELTQNCNFKCPMCAQGFDPKYQTYDPNRNMPIEMFTRIGEELFPKPINVDLRGFGESTILPYWPDVVDSLEAYP